VIGKALKKGDVVIDRVGLRHTILEVEDLPSKLPTPTVKALAPNGRIQTYSRDDFEHRFYLADDITPKGVTKQEAMSKAIIWRVFIAVPLGTLITYLWIGEVWKSISLMLFINVLFTFIHFVYELVWDRYIWWWND
jgi:hypothetical protein